MDETGHNRDGERHWLWAMVSKNAAYFEVVPSRGKKVVERLLAGFQHTLTSDRYSAYYVIDSSQRQLCWAHLKRDFTRFAQNHDRIVSRIGNALLDCESDLFSLWYQFKDGHITRNELNFQAEPIRKKVGELLEQGRSTAPEKRLSRFCDNLLKVFDALWTFLEVEGVDPTNNHAERSLRHSVIGRKKYFCTRSEYGSEFVANTASVRLTCMLQLKQPFAYLTQAVSEYFAGRPAPPIIFAAA